MPRPKKDAREVRTTLSASVLPEIDSQVKVIAIAKDRSNSWIVEKLLLRGLAAYKRDGLLEEPPALIPLEFENPVIPDGSDAPDCADELPEQDAQRAAELENALARLAGQQKRLVASQAKAESDELAELYGAETRKNEAERRTLQAELDRLTRSAASKLGACDDLVTLAKQVQAFARIPPQEDRRAVLVAFGVRVEADGRVWEFRIGAG